LHLHGFAHIAGMSYCAGHIGAMLSNGFQTANQPDLDVLEQ
jgi:hypothetical protein